MRSSPPLLLILLAPLTISVMGCKSNTYDRRDVWTAQAYGHTWNFYKVTRWEHSRPLMSGHGILVAQDMEYVTDYLENENGEKINVTWSLHAKHAQGKVEPWKEAHEVSFWAIYPYQDKLYLYAALGRPFYLFSDCKRMYIEGKPNLVLDPNKGYVFLGEYETSTKRFILDRVVPVPSSSKEYNALPNMIDPKYPSSDQPAGVVQHAEKYVCE